MELRNPFTAPGRWYKANLHAHTTTSDGQAGPAETAELYRKAGYDVLALTDHNATNDVAGLGREGFLVVGGMEYHPPCPGADGRPHHLVAINIPHGFAFDPPAPPDANRAIEQVRAAGGESILAHPLWCGHRYDQYAYLDGFVAMEVYNRTCDRIGRSAGETDYAHLLDAGRFVGAVAVDDTHSAADRFGGWTWLRMTELSAAAVVEALRSGRGYGSTGPTIHDFRIEDGQATVRCSPAESIYLSAQTYHGARREAAGDGTIRSFRHDVPDDWTYVRAVVVDRRGRRAWTGPIRL